MRPSSRHQRGAAALIVTLVLFFVMTLIAAFANRNLVVQQRASSNQVRATQAFEAAEAGIEWTIAMLNNAQPIDGHCVASGSGTAFRERYLSANASTGMQVPQTWTSNGTAMALTAACVRSADGWQCSCPASGTAAATAPGATSPTPAFTIRFAASTQPGTVQVVATGCSDLAGECAPANGSADATAHVQLTLGLVGALATPPTAAMTLKGSLHAGTAAIGLHNTDAGAAGIAVQSGGSIDAPQARLTTAAGGSLAAALVAHDSTLAALSNDRLFVSLFGIDKALWQQQPGVATVTCDGNCSGALAQATGTAQGHRMVWVDGDLTIEGPVTLGTPQRPVLIVASGALHFNGAVTLNGLVYGASLEWNNAPVGSASVHGAVVAEGGYQGNGAPDLVHDSGVLAALKTGTGSFARLPGSWKDF